MSAELLHAVEENIEKARESLALAESLGRLQANRDFRKVMVDGFFKEEAVRLVQAKAAPENQGTDAQKAIVSRIDAIGALYQYFKSIEDQADQARKTLSADEETREEILAESLK